MSVRINIMVKDVAGMRACYTHTSLLNIYAKLNKMQGERRNIWAVVEEKERKLRKDETHGV